MLFETLDVRSYVNYFSLTSKAHYYWVISANFYNVWQVTTGAFLLIWRNGYKRISINAWVLEYICISLKKLYLPQHSGLELTRFPAQQCCTEFRFWMWGAWRVLAWRIICTRRWLLSRWGNIRRWRSNKILRRKVWLWGGLLSGNLIYSQEWPETKFLRTHNPHRPKASSDLTANLLAQCPH